MRAARRCAENLPKPVKFTWPPLVSSLVTVSRNASTALPASLFDNPACAATRSTNSCLVTRQPSLGSGTNRSVTGASDPLNHAAFAGPSPAPATSAAREDRPHSHRETRESVDSALLAVDDADRISALETGRAERLDGLRGGASGGDDVLDQAHALAGLEGAFEPVAGAVVLLGLADDQERETRAKRRRRGERDGAELGAASRTASGSTSATFAAMRSAIAPSRSGRVSNRYLSR